MSITFPPLTELHFPLLLRWLETPHVKLWWDQDVTWIPLLIKEKYGSYVQGYKVLNGSAQQINAYIICCDEIPIGYIQIYNAHAFPRSQPLTGLPTQLAAVDLFIGEFDYVNRGIGTKVIQQFLQDRCDPCYTHVLVDPEINNIAAIKAYEKAGFKKLVEQPETTKVWMILECHT